MTSEAKDSVLNLLDELQSKVEWIKHKAETIIESKIEPINWERSPLNSIYELAEKHELCRIQIELWDKSPLAENRAGLPSKNCEIKMKYLHNILPLIKDETIQLEMREAYPLLIRTENYMYAIAPLISGYTDEQIKATERIMSDRFLLSEKTKINHILKCRTEFFEPIWIQLKSFEIRKNDRNFKKGDFVQLNEVDNSQHFTGRFVRVCIDYILYNNDFPEGIPKESCVFNWVSANQYNGFDADIKKEASLAQNVKIIDESNNTIQNNIRIQESQ